MEISSAGNTDVPAILVLESFGFVVTSEIVVSTSEMLWTARSDEHELTANSPLELLGLARLIDVRGEDWLASDEEIEHYLSLLQGGLGEPDPDGI